MKPHLHQRDAVPMATPSSNMSEQVNKTIADASVPAATTAGSNAGATATATKTSSETITQAAKPEIGLLPDLKTITLTFVPDWNWVDMLPPQATYNPNNQKPEDYLKYGRPVEMIVIFGPAYTLPQHADWSISIKAFVLPNSKTPTNKASHEHSINLNAERALIRSANGFNPRFEDALLQKSWRVSKNDDKKTISVTVRPYSEEEDPNALCYAQDQSPSESNRYQTKEGYFRFIQDHHYYMNFTFDKGSNIAKLVGLHSWRQMIYIRSRGFCCCSTTNSRLFTNFVTNWAPGVELPGDEYDETDEKTLNEIVLSISTMVEILQNGMLNSEDSYEPKVFGIVTAYLYSESILCGIQRRSMRIMNDQQTLEEISSSIPSLEETLNNFLLGPANSTSEAFKIITSYLYPQRLMNMIKNNSKIENDFHKLIRNSTKERDDEASSNMSLQQKNPNKRSMLQLFDLSIGIKNPKQPTAAFVAAATAGHVETATTTAVVKTRSSF